MAVSTMTKNHLSVKSPAFEANEYIPAQYTCEGTNINPEIEIGDIPDNARSLAIIMDDPDAPKGNFDHWIIWNIPVTKKIAENSAPGVQGQNGKKENKYTGPCPPTGVHHYHFNVYALDTQLDLPAGSNKKALLNAMGGHVVAKGELVGLYRKKQ